MLRNFQRPCLESVSSFAASRSDAYVVAFSSATDSFAFCWAASSATCGSCGCGAGGACASRWLCLRLLRRLDDLLDEAVAERRHARADDRVVLARVVGKQLDHRIGLRHPTDHQHPQPSDADALRLLDLGALCVRIPRLRLPPLQLVTERHGTSSFANRRDEPRPCFPAQPEVDSDTEALSTRRARGCVILVRRLPGRRCATAPRVPHALSVRFSFDS